MKSTVKKQYHLLRQAKNGEENQRVNMTKESKANRERPGTVNQ